MRALSRGFQIERLIEQIRTQLAQRLVAQQFARRQQFGNRHVESDGDKVGRPHQHAHIARGHPPPRARRIAVPAAVHAHVGMQHEVA